MWIRDPNGFCRSLVSRNPVADPVGMLRHAEIELDARLAKASAVGILHACTVLGCMRCCELERSRSIGYSRIK